MPIENDVLLTAAKEVKWRSECMELGEAAKKAYPNVRKYTCTAYEVIRDDGDTDGTAK